MVSMIFSFTFLKKKMEIFLFQTNENQTLSPIPHPFLTPPLAQTPIPYNFVNKISPSILLIIIILALIFFISGLLHLLVRYLFRPTSNDREDLDNSSTAFQGQLQHLFHLHDSGVDQSYIDKLPVFSYKSVIGLKNPFDCAVCLCEFESEDCLRLLPKCSHAFHLECIDTWLLSHSTCPLCRCSLIPDFSTSTTFSPILLVLESASESAREIVTDREATHLSLRREDEFGSLRNGFQNKSCEKIPVRDEAVAMVSEAKVVPVKLGKLRSVDVSGNVEGCSSGNINVDARRCYSMGSFEYVLDDRSQLQVAIGPSDRKPASKKPSLPPLSPHHRVAMSECDFHSSREVFKDFDMFRSSEIYRDGTSNISTGAIGSRRRESFSVSKIWLQSNKEKASTQEESSRRAFSFRLPLYQAAADELKPKHDSSSRRAVSEIYVGGLENGGSEMEFDEEVGRCDSLENFQTNVPSFAKRTLNWIVGRQKKVVHSSSITNV